MGGREAVVIGLGWVLVLVGCGSTALVPRADPVPAIGDEIPSTPRFARLTSLQWENSVVDLLELSAPTGLSDAFIGDANPGLDNNAEHLSVGPELWQDYQRSAEAVAAMVGIAPADPVAWIEDLGSRAHRRPLTVDELEAYAALFDLGPELIASGDDVADGVHMVVLAVLQSPFFLYRIEAGTEPDPEGRIPLSDYEVASRLSYALWNTMPDAALFEAAAAGALSTEAEVRAAAARLLEDPRAIDTVIDLHRQLLGLDGYANIFKDPILFPAFSASAPDAMRAEAEAYVAEVIGGGGGVHALYTAPHAGSSETLAPIYAQDPRGRGGLLTLSGFLAVHADAYMHSPIRRGVFVNEVVLCQTLPPPPDDVSPLPAPDGTMTLRQRVEAHTGDGTCGEGCHSTRINPPGFAFEHYDGSGSFRSQDNGMAVDASGSWDFTDGTRSFTDAAELSALLGDSLDAHRCYVQHWLEVLHGRTATAEDTVLLEGLAARSLTTDRPVLELMIDLVGSDSFRFRSPETLPDPVR